MKKKAKVVSLLLTFILTAGLTPASVTAVSDAAINTFDISEGNIAITSAGAGFVRVTYGNPQMTTADIPDAQEITLTGSSNTNTVTVNAALANLVLSDLEIDATAAANCAFKINGGSYVALILEGDNKLTSGDGSAGLQNADNASLSVGGSGSLAATGGNAAAGIGGSTYGNGGSIVIQDGSVTANGTGAGAGIGCGSAGSGGNITVSGGIVTAAGVDNGAGIGGGTGGTGIISITGGTIASSGGGPAPGIGWTEGGGTVTISGGTVSAKGITGGAGIGNGFNGFNAVTVDITGGVIAARGGASGGAGIGGGSGGTGAVITIMEEADVSASSVTPARSAIHTSSGGLETASTANILMTKFKTQQAVNSTVNLFEAGASSPCASLTSSTKCASAAFSVPAGAYRLKVGNTLMQYGVSPNNSSVFTITSAGLTSFSNVTAAVYYAVNIGALSGGAITASPAPAAAGETVNLTVTPDSGMRLKSDTLTYSYNANSYLITGASFTMPAAAVTVTAQFEADNGPEPSVGDVRLNTLAPGNTISFGGHNWIVLNPASGYLLLQNLGLSIRPFDTAGSTILDPAISTNVGNYLNTDFYNSLPGAAQDLIQPHTWGTGTVSWDNTGDENTSSVNTKIGLISKSEWNSYNAIIPAPPFGSGYWTRTGHSPGFVWLVIFNGLAGQQPVYGCYVRPAVYLPDDHLISPITYHLDEGTNSTLNPGFYISGTEFVFASPEKSGLIFEGWFDNEALQGSPVTGITAADAGEKILYASWRSLNSAVIDTTTAGFDKKTDMQSDVETGITWNEATSISAITAEGTALTLGTDYTVSDDDGDTAVLTIKKEYLALREVGSLELTIEFDGGEPAILIINISDSGLPPVNTVPCRKTGVPAEAAAVGKVNSVYTLNLDGIFEDADSDPLTYTVSINGAAEISANEQYSFTPKSEGDTVLEFKANDGMSDSVDAYTVTLTAEASENNGGKGGGTSVTKPSYNADIKENGTTDGSIPITVNSGTGSASVEIQKDSSFGSGGITVVTIPPISGVNQYTVELPAGYLSSPSDGKLTLNTEAGSITLPADMLREFEGAAGKTAGISIGQGDKSGLSDALQAEIGGRPLIQLTMTLDGKQTDWNNTDAPVTVSIPYKPTGDELTNPESIVIWYLDGKGSAVSIPNGHYNPVTGTVTFTTVHFSDYAVAYHPTVFLDVAEGAWYYKAVSFLAARGVTDGTGSKKFSPDTKLTRGEFIVMVMRAYSIEPDENQTENFSDAGNAYYTGYLAAARRLGISAGTGSNLFEPEREGTRQEMFTLLYNTLKVMNRLPQGDLGSTTADYSDAGLIETWANEAMAVLVETGIVEGNNGKLTPESAATRAEMAQVLYHLMSK